MDGNRANRSFVEVSGLDAIVKRSKNLRVPRIGPPKHPCGSSTAARYHCVRRPRAAAELDEKRGLEKTIRICKYFLRLLGRTLHAVALGFELCEHHRHGGVGGRKAGLKKTVERASELMMTKRS
jgi:hypothetical protein